MFTWPWADTAPNVLIGLEGFIPWILFGLLILGVLMLISVGIQWFRNRF